MGKTSLFVLSGLLVPVVLGELADWCPRLAEGLVRWSAARLRDPIDQERYLEEYLANLAEVPGKASRLVAATGYTANVMVMRWALGGRAAVRPLAAGRPRQERTLLRRAYRFAERTHRGVRRKNGDPYVTHPLAVAGIIQAYSTDATTLAAALLHDTADPGRDLGTFGGEIVELVASNTRAGERFTGTDARVLLLAIADRLHNLRTIEFVPAATQLRVARHTLDVVAPLADGLGYQSLGRELADRAAATLASLNA
jgi:HD domain